MWYEFPISTDAKKQREIVRQLRTWIESLETRGIVNGFAFDHYSPSPEALHIRFDCADKEHLMILRTELESEVKKFLPNYILPSEDRLWDGGKTPEQIYRAYEFGSRCAFLAWKLIEKGRFPEEYFSNFFLEESDKEIVARQIPFEFQGHLNHGVMNSLGVSKYPNEALVHSRILMKVLMEVKKVKNKQELADWIAKNLILK